MILVRCLVRYGRAGDMVAEGMAWQDKGWLQLFGRSLFELSPARSDWHT